ncbi:MAG: hypothetical protein FWD58_06005 [Firmicutes bacterium]|nr:hypothetical protein [Bacillota bacterium]
MQWTDLPNAQIFQQVMFIFGIAMGAVLIIQILMMLFGLGHDTTFDHDGHFDHDGGDMFNHDGAAAFGMRMLSVRSIIAFLGVGSWVCFTLLYYWPIWGAVLMAVAAGLAAAAAMAFALTAIQKLQNSGNVSMENALGKSGEVYLRIPGTRGGSGKIQVMVQERMREYDALTDADRLLKTGEKVKVTAIVDDNTVLVEPI